MRHDTTTTTRTPNSIGAHPRLLGEARDERARLLERAHGDVDRAKGLERYVRHQLASLALTPTEALFDGRVRFVGFDEQEE